MTKLEGDHDVFGDGSVTIIATPGHTPGHQSLLVRLPKTGAVVLSGDASTSRTTGTTAAWCRRSITTRSRAASMQAHGRHMAKEKAQLWINHDKAQRDSLKLSPNYYD